MNKYTEVHLTFENGEEPIRLATVNSNPGGPDVEIAMGDRGDNRNDCPSVLMSIDDFSAFVKVCCEFLIVAQAEIEKRTE